MADYLTPGVYVEEFSSSEPTMSSVSTSTAGFIGVTEKGPQYGAPVLITNFASFRRIFGGYLTEREFGQYRYLTYAINQFFANGGSRCYIKRVVPSDASYSYSSEQSPVVFYAKEPGEWGNKITITITKNNNVKTQILEEIENKYRVKSTQGFLVGDIVCVTIDENVYYNRVIDVDDNIITMQKVFEKNVTDDNIVPQIVLSVCKFDIRVKYDLIEEKYENCSFNRNSYDFVAERLTKSELIMIDIKEIEEDIPHFLLLCEEEKESCNIRLLGGKNGTKQALSAIDFIGEDKGPNNRSGLQSFIDNNEINLIAVPGITDAQVLLSLIAHCENMGNRFAILDIPREKKTVNDIVEYRDLFDSDFAAMYHPWVKVADPITKNAVAIPPSGSVAGVYARTDNTRGVFKAPANEIVSACVGLDCNYTTGEQDVLNPKGVNLIRSFSGSGIRIWGARTISSNSLWRYVNVRRLFLYIEESIRVSTNWVVFEPNEPLLWLRVKRTIELFLGDLWRTGALVGGSEGEAFFVDIGANTMTQSDIDNGKLICVIGVAPVKPAEFVIFRITQKTNGAI
ncbi:phage tail sheath family protein [Clostridium sp. MD294]|uniref:phage tail sheath family protein n=1 Tax=Clostridium sp. MD294 TaxID=97138 RepID=UPI0002CA4C6D|nr:phage tail sheath family protein [Clostridium sp. MD294]NDO46149.1 phage tail sheath family protein [Clostridium sp. MD294]USF30185.1 hypothetical protein C820_001626 [Clostridium sp. MD294]